MEKSESNSQGAERSSGDRAEARLDDQIRRDFVNSTKVESLLNRDGDVLPYAYMNPETDGKLIWMCGEDQEGRITSVFCFENNGVKEKQSSYVENLDKAKFMRSELIKAGWKKLEPPKVEFTMPGGGSKVLNRKQRRILAKKLREEAKKHPMPQEPGAKKEESSDEE